MLSIENPSPDPPCPFQFPQLNDERPSHTKLPLPELLDLPISNSNPNSNSNPSLDHLHHNPLPNFSIRDYVLTSRSKDISKNWPFSLKNLQLCLRHGVKDVLPPFQPLETVRNHSYKGCTVDTSPLEKQTETNFDKQSSSRPDNHVGLDSSDYKLAESCADITSSCRSGEANYFPSTTTSVSQSETFDNRQSSSTLKASSQVEPATPPVTQHHKTDSTSRPLAKKCRLIVKFGANWDRSPTEDIASDCTAASETMASKVCPVCKTFSSSSNTTLNAHIDQCLSVESTPKWTADSKLTRHRIKPRKTRLMADIYATALQCTLEDLDRRNGTSWATVPRLPAQDAEKNETTSNERKKQRVSPIYPQDVEDVGPVYIDANGTKLRILSNFNDQLSLSKVGEDIVARKPLKEGEGSKYISKKKKKGLVRKHQKYLKLVPQSKKVFSDKAHGSKIYEGQGHNGEQKICEKEHQMRPQMKTGDSGTLRPWVCSKRRGFTKKVVSPEGHQTVRCKWHLPQDLLVEKDQSFLGDSIVERSDVQESIIPSENLICSPGNNDKMEKPSHKAQVSDKREQSPGRKRVDNLLVGSRFGGNTEQSYLASKQNANRVKKDGNSMHDSCMPTPPNSTKNIISSLIKKNYDTHVDATNKADIALSASTKSSCDRHAIVAEAMGFSSFRKNALSIGSQSPVAESRLGETKKSSALNESQVHFMSERNEEVNVDSSVRIGDDFVDEIDSPESSGKEVQVYGDAMVVETSARTNDGRSAGGLSKTLDIDFYKLSSSSRAQPSSFQSLEDYQALLCGTEAPPDPVGPDFVSKEDVISADDVGNGMMGQDTDLETVLDSEAGQGDSFPVVDPILIPGPPGSFLPSPRDMGSEDFQGNSSLTTSRVQSSLEQHDVVDGDLSDSPISTASSIISNTAADRSDPKCFDPLSSVLPYGDQEGTKSGLTGGSIEPSVLTSGTVLQATSSGTERTVFDEEYSLSSKNDQPCCCQRKERFTQGLALNHHESPLLRRRKMTSLSVPSVGKQVVCNSNPIPNLDVRSEFVPSSSCPSSRSENLVVPILKPPAGATTFKDTPDAGARLLARADSGSASPSASNPVLRLMGKNLLVVNKDDDACVPSRQVQPHFQKNHHTPQFSAFSTFSPGNLQNQDFHPFHHVVSQGTVLFGQDQRSTSGQCFDVGMTNNFRSHCDLKIPQAPARLPAGMFRDQCITDGFTTSMGSAHDYKGDHNSSSRPNNLKNRQSTYNMEKVVATPDCPYKHADSSSLPEKEIIIDDAPPESEMVLTSDVAKCAEGWRETQVVTSGILISTPSSYKPSHVHPFSCYSSQDHNPLGEPPMARKSSFHANPATGPATPRPVMWGCTSEGSGTMQQRNPFVAASSSTGHLRYATLYYPSSFT